MSYSDLSLLRYFDQHELLERVPDVFILLACVYAAMNFVGSLLLSKPEPIREQVRCVS